VTRRLALFTLAPFLTAAALAQAVPQTPAPASLTFDIVSIRPSNENSVNGGIKPLPNGNGYTARNFPVKLMISLMYRIPMRQIKGGPEWLNTERFDVDAKADRTYGVEELHTMYKNMLADRLSLKFHMESKPGNIYSLTVDPTGLKMKPNTTPDDFKIPVNFTPAGFQGIRVSMPYLCWFLGQQLQDDARPVVDQTGLNGNFDFMLSFKPVNPPVAKDDTGAPPDDRPSIYEALRQQLGLHLQPTKGPVDYFVIDSVQKPSAN
jgi:uncharacterized protein (TIGR03435 family)